MGVPPFPASADLLRHSQHVLTRLFSLNSGGEEVLLDVAGQDATVAFEDVVHSDEARETLEQLKVGTLKRNVSSAFLPTGTKGYRRRGITIVLTRLQ